MKHKKMRGMALLLAVAFLLGAIAAPNEVQAANKLSKYEQIYPFSNGLAAVVTKSGKLGFIDKKGNVVTTPKYAPYAYKFSEGLVRVETKNRKFGYVDKTGKEVIKPQYSSATDFSGGRALVTKNGTCSIINKKGKVLKKVAVKNVVAMSFSEGVAYAFNHDEKVILIDKTGKVILKPEANKNYKAFIAEEPVTGGMLLVSTKNGRGLINTKGKLIVRDMDSASPSSDGLALVAKNGKYYYVDKKGKNVFKTTYSNAFSFSEGLAMVVVDDKSGFIDTKGRFVIEPRYPVAGSFVNGFSAVLGADGEWGFIDKKGNEVVDLEYDLVQDFSDGLAEVKKDGKWGFVDTKGKVVVDLQYDEVLASFSDGAAVVRKGDNVLIINKKGKVLAQ